MSMVKTTPTPIQHHDMKHLNHLLGAASEHTDAVHLCELKKLPLHGQFFVQQDNTLQVDVDWSTHWLTKAHLRGETDAVLCVAMEQTLATNK
eukprot:8624236-Ditylum_brightwellii.AAC.1